MTDGIHSVEFQDIDKMLHIASFHIDAPEVKRDERLCVNSREEVKKRGSYVYG